EVPAAADQGRQAQPQRRCQGPVHCATASRWRRGETVLGPEETGRGRNIVAALAVVTSAIRMIELFQQTLPHGITLSCRAAGERGRPVLMFLHGFPEAAFVWDVLLEHFARPENGGYRCVAPNLRGYERSTQPAEVKEYRAKYLVQDIAALIQIEGAPLECLVAHDWGGAVAWNLANQLPQLIKRLAIVNSPHPGTFLRELKSNPRQQAASAYMNFLIRPDAEQLLAENDFKRIFGMLTNGSPATWLTDEVKQQYRKVWSRGLTG